MMELKQSIASMVSAPRWAAVYEINGNTTAIPLVSWACGHWCYAYSGEESPQSSIEREGEFKDHVAFGLVVNDGSVVPARSLPDFQTYDYDFEGTDTDYMDMKNG